MQVLADYLLLTHHQKCKRAGYRGTECNATWYWWRRVSRHRPVLERHGQHVIRLCVEDEIPGAQHGLQRLLYREAGGAVFLDERHRARALRAYGFHRGGI